MNSEPLHTNSGEDVGLPGGQSFSGVVFDEPLGMTINCDTPIKDETQNPDKYQKIARDLWRAVYYRMEMWAASSDVAWVYDPSSEDDGVEYEGNVEHIG